MLMSDNVRLLLLLVLAAPCSAQRDGRRVSRRGTDGRVCIRKEGSNQQFAVRLRNYGTTGMWYEKEEERVRLSLKGS